MDYLEYNTSTDTKYKLEYFMETLSPTNRTPQYYINWKKVIREAEKFELELNTLNYLIGKNNIEEEAESLFKSQPYLLKAIPTLIASRDKNIEILFFNGKKEMEYANLDFNNIDLSRMDDYLKFIRDTGLLNFIKNSSKRSLVDYTYGVEAGLDSNARKNRSGTIMEEIVEKYIIQSCDGTNIEYISQATSDKINKNWGIKVPVDKSKRRFDFAVINKDKNKVFVIETNYYAGGGSKLKSVAGEFITLNSLINKSEDDVEFIWITDGKGWNTAYLPLSEAFEQIRYVFNLKMLKNNYLTTLF